MLQKNKTLDRKSFIFALVSMPYKAPMLGAAAKAFYLALISLQMTLKKNICRSKKLLSSICIIF